MRLRKFAALKKFLRRKKSIRFTGTIGAAVLVVSIGAKNRTRTGNALTN